ncbi:ABC transporter ATP-binding protein [Nonomuraea gerenzanensis]|uniref:Glycerol-3-phosphate ABC transporter, ATP-binding protein UgpC (TC 3.A.1.1.3) n=1 Tax=Nonomuraea gerenzanensis TaxID=93944 RepID=A0A1M4E8I9_9ACTN|nr:ATP-binding cassette domain-containing protein [Nonomuraea gerenzanensis]UBU17312.1 ATP-binding cassette domain-containing protein [Nonomuraea gerenzanensis]SBO95058.1 Glycerol-3-phosphate ABC transporter, ATP-binding protein UgpC (TC 3.A.1.1.3) [Nonomuraea gerenzanensis]
MSSVVLDKVSKVYPGDYLAVDRLSLRAEDGEFLVLLGPSGCGKSTLLRMIAGLEEITDGELWLDGEMANHLAPRDRDVAMVFQNGALYPHRTVRGNIAFPLEIAKSDPALVRERVTELSKALHIDETLDRRPGTLSGGQRQRVAMGRAIVRQPKLFLMDEPLSNLDAGMRTELRMEISALVRSLGVTTIYVTHDQVEALTLADRIAILNRGVLQDVGTPAQIYNDPATAFVAAFLNSQQLNLLAAGVRTPQNQYVMLDFGPHRLTMPWSDPRAYAISQHTGGQVLVGLRPDGLAPVPESYEGPSFFGRVRALEYHGHEWLAYLECGMPAVPVPEPPDPRGRGGRRGNGEHNGSGKLSGLVRRLFPRQEPEWQDQEQVGTHPNSGIHRRSDLIVRLGGRPIWRAGDAAKVGVDLSRIMIFTMDGARIDPPRR